VRAVFIGGDKGQEGGWVGRWVHGGKVWLRSGEFARKS
jgi:hypothetical protein